MTGTKYTKEHEWLRIDGDTASVGITEYARHALGDLVYLDLPETGKTIRKGEHFAVVESVKAASEIYAPVSGEIVEVNAALQDNLDQLKEDLDTGWIVKIRMTDDGEAAALMDQGAYKSYTESLG